MPCTSPRDCWPAPAGARSRRPVHSPQQSYPGAKPFSLPCGQCISCRLSKAQDWATRVMNETRLHDDNWFITATYSDAFLPSDGSLNEDHHTLFMKKLRHMAEPNRIRFLMCGEYGEEFGRPHFHYIVHGLPLPDLRHHSGTDNHELGVSKQLEEVWGMGHIPVARVTHESAAYVASYTLKRVTGERAENYIRPHPLTGQPFRVRPEFARMSRRPGLGAGWLDQWGRTDLSGDFQIVAGQRKPIPRYYVSKLAPEQQGAYTARRQERAMRPNVAEDSTERRLIERHESARLKALRRKRDGGG